LERSDEIKSTSSENTFLQDTDDRPTPRKCLREQAEEIKAKPVRRRPAAFTVQVKVCYGDFTTLTRQMYVERASARSAGDLPAGCWLLGREKLAHRPLRLVGLGVSGLHEVQARQLALGLPVNQ